MTTQELSVETVALLESDPEAVPTFDGVTVVRDVPEGDHQLTVNGPGVAPHSESVTVGDDGRPTTAGVEGEIPLVARENALKLEVDTGSADADLTGLAVEDDFAGRLYDTSLSGPDAVYLHRGGAYTTEIRDRDDEVGAYRVNPDGGAGVRIDDPRTGKASLAEYLGDVAEETSTAVKAAADGDDDLESGDGTDDGGSGSPVQELVRVLDAVADAARRAAGRAGAGNRSQADESLATVQDRLARVETRLTDARSDLPDDLGNAIDRRLEQLRRRSEEALAATTL